VLKHRSIIGGIVKHKGGYGFRITFDTVKHSQKYKDMMMWILESDKFRVDVKKGYYDEVSE